MKKENEKAERKEEQKQIEQKFDVEKNRLNEIIQEK